MCPSSWKLYVDDFLFFSSSLAHLEPELELFEDNEIRDDGDTIISLRIFVSLKQFSFLLSCFTLLHWLREENPPNKLMSEKLFCLPRLSIERIYRGAAGAGIPARWSSKEI